VARGAWIVVDCRQPHKLMPSPILIANFVLDDSNVRDLRNINSQSFTLPQSMQPSSHSYIAKIIFSHHFTNKPTHAAVQCMRRPHTSLMVTHSPPAGSCRPNLQLLYPSINLQLIQQRAYIYPASVHAYSTMHWDRSGQSNAHAGMIGRSAGCMLIRGLISSHYLTAMSASVAAETSRMDCWEWNQVPQQ